MTEKEIETMFMNDVAREKLHVADKLLNSRFDTIRKSAPNLLLTADEGYGLTTYGKAYAKIVDESLALKVRGRETFLELVFPKNNEMEEKLFYDSPRVVAEYRNRFYGTMIISLREYTGMDLIKSESLGRLLEFIEGNKDNIHFIFHILPEFSAQKKLLAKLREVTNIDEVIFDKPGSDLGRSYIVDKLNDNGVSISKTAVKLLGEKVLPGLVAMADYKGYKSLSSFVDRLYLEIGMWEKGEEDLIIDESMVEQLEKKMLREAEEKANGTYSIGFVKGKG